MVPELHTVTTGTPPTHHTHTHAHTHTHTHTHTHKTRIENPKIRTRLHFGSSVTFRSLLSVADKHWLIINTLWYQSHKMILYEQIQQSISCEDHPKLDGNCSLKTQHALIQKLNREIKSTEVKHPFISTLLGHFLTELWCFWPKKANQLIYWLTELIPTAPHVSVSHIGIFCLTQTYWNKTQ